METEPRRLKYTTKAKIKCGKRYLNKRNAENATVTINEYFPALLKESWKFGKLVHVFLWLYYFSCMHMHIPINNKERKGTFQYAHIKNLILLYYWILGAKVDKNKNPAHVNIAFFLLPPIFLLSFFPAMNWGKQAYISIHTSICHAHKLNLNVAYQNNPLWISCRI